MIELYRAMVPEGAIINDNHGQHYRIKQGKYDLLYRQFDRIQSKDTIINENCDFAMPTPEEVKEYIGDRESVILICEVFKYKNYRFDPPNYSATFKPLIDKLIKFKYLIDDSYYFIEETRYRGGNLDMFKKRAIRYEGDNLPDEITQEWWNNITNSYNDIFIRIFIK